MQGQCFDTDTPALTNKVLPIYVEKMWAESFSGMVDLLTWCFSFIINIIIKQLFCRIEKKKQKFQKKKKEKRKRDQSFLIFFSGVTVQLIKLSFFFFLKMTSHQNFEESDEYLVNQSMFTFTFREIYGKESLMDKVLIHQNQNVCNINSFFTKRMG